jgi:hypothetical protein
MDLLSFARTSQQESTVPAFSKRNEACKLRITKTQLNCIVRSYRKHKLKVPQMVCLMQCTTLQPIRLVYELKL